MILLGCLLAFSIAIAPRLVLILAWIFSDRWDVVWQGEWIWPLLGIIFLPYTTIMYLLVWSFHSGIEGFDWFWILMGLFLDLMKWYQMWVNRQEAAKQTQKYYPSGAPRIGGPSASAAVSSGQVPPSTSPTAPDQDTSPTASATPPESDKDEDSTT